jgi:rsbT co-antagonist protein RsbR
MSKHKEADILDKIWEIQDVLQAASAGDYTKRLETSIEASLEENPLVAVSPAVNLLLDDLQSKERKQQRTERKLREAVADLENKLDTISKQDAAIRELSTPVMEIWEDILLLPIVGVVDTRRSMDIMDNLLRSITNSQAKCVILDITGVEVVDTKTADYMLKVVRAANLLGAKCVMTGLSPAVAQTLVEIGADLTEVNTLRSIKEGLKDCLAYMQQQKKIKVGSD